MSLRVVLLAIAALVAMPARADLYSAQLAYKKGDFEVAYKQYRELAELGQPTAQLNVAIMHARGQGVPLNMTFAHAWASIAAESGHPKAQQLADEIRPVLTPGSLKIADEMREQFGRAALDALLMPNLSGIVPAGDRERCRLVKAPENRYPDYARRLGIQGQVYAEFVVMPDGRARLPRIMLAMPPKTFDDTVRQTLREATFTPARVAGRSVPCAYGLYFRFSLVNVEAREYVGLDTLVKETQTKAEGGDIPAQMLYGFLIAGLPQLNRPRSEALPWFLKAAQAGQPLAQFQIGSSLMKGWGCECEENKGLIWLRKAAEADQPDAQVSLASYALRGTPNDENLARARTWLERAAAQDHRDAKLYLSALLASAPSEGMRDPQRALALLKDVFRDVDDDPIAFEIRAAAAASSNNFTAALKDQARAVAMAKKLGWDLAAHTERLERYRGNQPWFGDLLGMAGAVEAF